jgi:hypothetical protein
MTEPISRNAAVASAVELVRRFVVQCHPTAEAALFVGSRARESGGVGSDHDVVLLFLSMPSSAWREMALFEGRNVEVRGSVRGGQHHACAGPGR